MLDHFLAVTALERAVVRGDPVATRDHATALARERTGDPAGWAKRVAELQSVARAVRPKPASEAARGVVAILRVCAGCHADLDVDLEPNSVPDPPLDDSLASKMRRHQWGMDLLRIALLFDKDDLWLRGAGVLTKAPLDPAELAESGVINPETIVYARRLRGAAAVAANEGRSRRLDMYQTLLGTCVGCHAE